MNRELFRSMQGQLRPSEAARTALSEKLARTPPARRCFWRRYRCTA